MDAYMAAGGRCWWSDNDCFTTRGLCDDKDVGIPTRFLVNITSRWSGDELWALPTPVLDETGGLEDAECVAEVSLAPEEANLLMGRVAYDMNHVIQDMEGMRLEAQPPLTDEVEVLSEASDWRPGTRSGSPAPGATKPTT